MSGTTSNPSADQTRGIFTKEAWPVYATSLIEVVRITLNAEMDTSPRYKHARTAIPTLHSHRNFSRSYQQVEHNASLLTIYGLLTLRKPTAKIRHFFQMRNTFFTTQ